MFWSTLYYGLLISSGFILKNLRPDLKQLFLLATLSVVVGVGYLLSKLVIASYLWRNLTLLDPSAKGEFVGKPLLFPARLSHARRFPETERYNYWYDYFMVGIPVGLRGRIGSLLSIDNIPAWERRRERCWFTIDPTYYLDRGSGDRSLEERLHIFLRSVGENPLEFPYAYLISVPRFLWWQKSAISYWYLHSSTRELKALIMEISNSFYEKRNIFLRVTGDGLAVDDAQSPATVITASTKDTKETVSIRFWSSAPQSKNYKGSFEKLIFGSPYEKVGGSMPAKFVDPLLGPALQSILSSTTPEASGRSIASFIIRWTHVGVLSAPRIVKEAIKIRLRGNLKYLQRPEVREGSVPRKETEVEKTLELYFRNYLTELTAHCQFPLSITYIPPKSLHFDPITISSQTTPTSLPRATMTIQPLTPRFYTSFPQHPDAETAFATETAASPTNSDPDSRRLLVSDLPLLDRVLKTAGLSLNAQQTKTGKSQSHNTWLSLVLHTLISFLRGSSVPTFMDRFVLHDLPTSKQWNYQTSTLHYLLACRLPIESQAIVALGFIATRMLLMYVFLSAVYSVWGHEEIIQWLLGVSVTPRAGCFVFGGWEMVHGYLGKYYLNPFGWGEGL